MIDRELKRGDYIFSANGYLARITKVNKQTYSIEIISGNYLYADTIPFNGIKHGYYASGEWFYCDDPTAKALDLVLKNYKSLKLELESLTRKTEYLTELKEKLEECLDMLS